MTPVIDYDSGVPRPRNRAALLSFLFGAALFVPLLPVVPAIALGRRGLDHARRHASGCVALARWGRTLGLINLLVWVPALSLYGVHAWREADVARRRADLRVIGQALLLYANDNRGRPPDSWAVLLAAQRQTLADLVRRGATDRVHLAGGWNPPPPDFRKIGSLPEHFVMAWETPRARADTLFLFDLNAEIKRFPPGLAKRIDADLRAGWNPPPTLDADAARQIRRMATTRAVAATSPAQ